MNETDEISPVQIMENRSLLQSHENSDNDSSPPKSGLCKIRWQIMIIKNLRDNSNADIDPVDNQNDKWPAYKQPLHALKSKQTPATKLFVILF